MPTSADVLPLTKRRPADPTAPPHGRIVATLGALMAFASISTDLYLPAMPSLGASLGDPAGRVEYTLTGFLVGFSLGQLVWGPIGDRFGRRLPVLAGLALFAVGSIGCALSGSVAEMIGWRVVQALGACAGPVLARAMARDLYGRDGAAHLLSTLMLVMGIAPLLGPLVGGQILAVASWRAVFWVLVIVAGAIAAAVAVLPETLPVERRSREPLGRAFAEYGQLLRNRDIVGYAVASGLYYAGIYAYLAGTPAAYIDHYHVPATAYGLLFGVGIVGQMVLAYVNTRLVGRLGSDRLLRWGALLVGVSGCAAGVAAWSGLGGLPGLVVTLFLFISANGIFIANAVAGALEACPTKAGATSALVGAVQFGSGIFGTAAVGWFADGTPHPMGGVIAVTAVLSLLAVHTLIGRGDRRREAAA